MLSVKVELIQGSPEWRRARCGSLGASDIADMMARTRTGYGASRANLLAQLLIERLTGVPTEGYMSDAMRWGLEKEPEARAAYEFRTNADVAEIGLVRHTTIGMTHASPDGLVGDDGLLELKCPTTATHIDTLLGQTVPDKYVKQVMWQMACTGRQWADYVSYDPRMPEAMRLWIKRVPRDDAKIAELEHEVTAFLAELDERVRALTKTYGAREPAPLLMAG